MTINHKLEALAKELWDAESYHVTGKPRRVSWEEAPELDHKKFRFLADAAMTFNMMYIDADYMERDE